MKLLSITANVFNGEFISPKIFTVQCDSVVPIGENLIRNFDENACIVVKRVFLIQHGLDVLGTIQFKTKDEFYKYKDNQCNKCVETGCGIYVNGVQISINGCKVNSIIDVV